MQGGWQAAGQVWEVSGAAQQQAFHGNEIKDWC
jgi:hypothetical protein